MRIAYILDSFPRLSETFILNQITGLLDLGHQVDIFAQSNPQQAKVHPDVKAYRLMERTRYFRVPAGKIEQALRGLGLVLATFHDAPARVLKALNVWRFGKQALSFRTLFYLTAFLNAQQDYDVIHCHFGPNGKIGVLLKQLNVGRNVVTSYYGQDVRHYIRQHGTQFYDSLFERGDLFIAISRHMKKQLAELGCHEDKILIHPLGIDVGKFGFRLRAPGPGGRVKILTVARLVEKKGLEHSIRAVAHLMQEFPRLEYRIAGNGPLRGHLESLLSKLGVQDRVRLLGWQDQEEVRRLYEQSHIFVLASVTASDGDEEGTPTVLLEAQAQGLPVVSTTHAAIPEITLNDRSAFLVPQRDVDALETRLRYLICHPEVWPGMGRAGRHFVEERHDIKKLNRRLAQIYQALAAGHL
jgi:colanic acid/amylovoran biosynthesis glycosyltransferase